jgi:hypothetical protein
MLPNCVGSTDARTWRLADGPEALRFSFEGSRGVGRPKVGTDWCGNVKSITEQIQHTLNIAKVTAQAKGQPALRRVAPRRSPASLDAVRSQPEVDTQDDDDDEQKVEGGSVREAVLTNLWLTALNQAAHIRPVSGRQAELAQTACLIKAGTLLNIYYHHGTRDCECCEVESVLDLRLDQKIDGASGCLHSCMHWRGSG